MKKFKLPPVYKISPNALLLTIDEVEMQWDSIFCSYDFLSLFFLIFVAKDGLYY